MAVVRMLGLVVVGTSVLLSLPCGGIASSEPLEVWTQVRDRNEQFNWIIDRYVEENPDVEVNVQLLSASQTELTEQLLLAVVSGASPDLTWLEGSTVRELAAQGILLDVTEALQGLRFTPADTEEMTYRGRMYAAPYHATSRGLLKRVDFFEQAGLDPHADPDSLDELSRWNARLTVTTGDGTYERVGIIPWVGNWGAAGWIWTFGGRLINEDENGMIYPTADDPRNAAAFNWLHEIARPFGGAAPVRAGWVGFRDGTVAMAPESTTAVGRLLSAGVELTTGRVPHPPEGANGTWGGGHAVGVPSNAPNPAEAMQLLRYFAEPDVQLARVRRFPDALPANWDALQSIAPTLPEAYGPLLDQFPEARARTPLWLEYLVHQLNPAMNAVIRNEKTPEQALAEVQQYMERRFTEVFGVQ